MLTIALFLGAIANGQSGPFSRGSSSRSSSPYDSSGFGGQDAPRVIGEETFDVAKIGQPGRIETTLLFNRIWEEFRSSHRLNDDGGFEAGGTFTDSPDNQAFFLHHLANKPYTLRLQMNEVCPRCEDKGYKSGRVRSRYRGSMDEIGNVACDLCEGRGGPKGLVEYTVIYSGPLPAVPESPAQARMRVDLKKAESGDKDAQMRVGEAYWEGAGAPMNREKGLRWIGLAAMAGDTRAARKVIAMLSRDEIPEFFDPGYASALHLMWLPRSEVDWQLTRHPQPLLGDLEARILMEEARNLMLSETKARFPTPSEVRLAVRKRCKDWEEKAATGDEKAAYLIGICKLQGIGVPPNAMVGVGWLEKAAAKGHSGSLHALGCLHELGTYYARNMTAAFVMYTLASKVAGNKPVSAAYARDIQSRIEANEAYKYLPDLELMARAGKLSPQQLEAIGKLPPGDVATPVDRSARASPAAPGTEQRRTRPAPTGRSTVFGVEIR